MRSPIRSLMLLPALALALAAPARAEKVMETKDALKKALAVGHGIDIDQIPGGDPMLFVVADQQAAKKMADFKIPNPTLLQIIGASRVIALTEQDAIDRFEKLMQAED